MENPHLEKQKSDFLRKWLTVRESSEYFGVSQTWFRDKIVPHVRFIKAGCRRYNVDEVQAFMEALGAMEGPSPRIFEPQKRTTMDFRAAMLKIVGGSK